VVVLEDGCPPRPLEWRLDLRNHSPTGLEWGYGGSGPAQPALALAADVLRDDAELDGRGANRISSGVAWELSGNDSSRADIRTGA